MGGVATVLLDNAAQRNPLSKAVLNRLNELLAVCDEAAGPVCPGGSRQPKISVVVLKASGSVFSSGHDFADFLDTDESGGRIILDACAQVNMKLRAIPQPTVAIVEGLATAGGCQLACSCDLVLASEKAYFQLPGSKGKGFCHTPVVAVAERIG